MTKAERNKRWKEKDPEKARRIRRESYHRRKHDPIVAAKYKQRNKERHIIRAYGHTLAEKDAILAAQNWKCFICGTAKPGSKKGWHWDHNHKTGHMLSILCHHCNVALGQAQHSPTRLLALAAYAETYHA